MSQPQKPVEPPLSADEAETIAFMRAMSEKQRTDLLNLIRALAAPARNDPKN